MEREVTDPDILGAEPALQRAAKEARIVAAFTDTPLVIWENGRIKRKRISLTEARRLQRELRDAG